MTQAERLLHEAHLRYQRAALRRDAVQMESIEVHGVRYRYTVADWLASQRLDQRNAVMTGLRSNFWSAYIDTVIFMGK